MKIVHCFVPPIFHALSSYAAEVLTDEQVYTKSRITLSSETVPPRRIYQIAGDRAARVIQLMSLRSIPGRFEVAFLSDTNRRDLIRELGSYLEAAES